jgi:hypothetical protein
VLEKLHHIGTCIESGALWCTPQMSLHFKMDSTFSELWWMKNPNSKHLSVAVSCIYSPSHLSWRRCYYSLWNRMLNQHPIYLWYRLHSRFAYLGIHRRIYYLLWLWNRMLNPHPIYLWYPNALCLKAFIVSSKLFFSASVMFLTLKNPNSKHLSVAVSCIYSHSVPLCLCCCHHSFPPCQTCSSWILMSWEGNL